MTFAFIMIQTEGHLEDWDETTTYADYFQDLSNRVDAQVAEK